MSKYQYQTINGKKDRVHRHVMSEHINRPLMSHEHVYHLNGDHFDNRIENLVLITKKCEGK